MERISAIHILKHIMEKYRGTEIKHKKKGLKVRACKIKCGAELNKRLKVIEEKCKARIRAVVGGGYGYNSRFLTKLEITISSIWTLNLRGKCLKVARIMMTRKKCHLMRHGKYTRAKLQRKRVLWCHI